jgi:hypothetical protein
MLLTIQVKSLKNPLSLFNITPLLHFIPMKILQTILLCIVLNFLLSPLSFSIDDKSRTRLGFSYSIGKQQIFPYNSHDYVYNTKGYKALINHSLSTSKLSIELQAEPSLYFAHHQLLEETFVQPDYGPDYLAKREIYTKMKTITESALNLGVVMRYNFSDKFSLYLLGSIGPMYSDTETERLAKGLAFSDIAGIGASLKINKFMFEVRTGVRHVSNADMKFPNSGHNSSTLDFSISYFLGKLPVNDTPDGKIK